MCRIFKVGGWLDPKGFDKRILEIEVNEPTTTIAFRVPVSKVDELKDMVNAKLSEWFILK